MDISCGEHCTSTAGVLHNTSSVEPIDIKEACWAICTKPWPRTHSISMAIACSHFQLYMTGQHAEGRAGQTEPCEHEVMAPPSDSVQTSQDQDLHHHGSPHRTIYFMDSTSPDYGEATSNNLLYSCMHLWWYMNSTNHLLYTLLLQKPYTSCTVQEAHHQMCSSVLHSCTV